MRVTLMAAVFAALLVLLASECSGFKPDEPGHVGITESALASLGFCRHARDAVEDANVLTDIFEQLVSEAHFDDESLRAGSQRLLSLRELIVDLIDDSVSGDDEDEGIFSFFSGVEIPGIEFLQDALTSTTGLSGGFLSVSNTKQQQAWTALGQALHSLQDFYSHSNWVEMGSSDINRDLGERELDNPDNTMPCPSDPAVLDLNGDGGNTLTTSYFLFDPSAHCALEEFDGKCRHGWDLAGCASGLNKDEASRPGNAEAKEFAIEATAAYVNAILEELRDLSEDHRDAFLGGEDCSGVPLNETVIFRRSSSLEPTNSCDSFSFVIDEVGEDYVIDIELENYDSITLRNSNNQVVDESLNGDDDDDNYTVNDDDDDSRSYELSDPVRGTYQLEVCGTNRPDYTVSVTAQSDVFPFRFFFSRLAGTRNEGEFPHTANQQPLLNTENRFTAELYGSDIDSGSLRFTLLALDGVTELQSFIPEAGDVAFDGIDFEQALTLTTSAKFQVQVTGQLTNGDTFVRVFQTKELQAQTVEVQFTSELTSFQLGPDQDEVTLRYILRNLADTAEEFELSFSIEDDEDGLSGAIVVGSARRLASRSITLQGGASLEVDATLSVEDDDEFEGGDIIQATFTASNGADNGVNAVDVIGQYVLCRGDPICSGQGTCSGSSDVCDCFFNSAGDDCSQSASSSFSASSPFSLNNELNTAFGLNDDDDDNGGSSGVPILLPSWAIIALASLFITLYV